jgi:RraA family protein
MGRLQTAVGTLIARHEAGETMCGSAFTVKTAPGDNLMVQKAIDIARPGDVIVVDGGGAPEQALVGEIMSAYARSRGIAGFVVNGAVRDLDVISASRLPIYATSVTPRGPTRVGPGEINIPINICGMVVSPGDIIVGDADGVVAVPREAAKDVLAAARSLREREEAMLAAVQRGELDRLWIDAALRAGGCEDFTGKEAAFP